MAGGWVSLKLSQIETSSSCLLRADTTPFGVQSHPAAHSCCPCFSLVGSWGCPKPLRLSLELEAESNPGVSNGSHPFCGENKGLDLLCGGFVQQEMVAEVKLGAPERQSFALLRA